MQRKLFFLALAAVGLTAIGAFFYSQGQGTQPAFRTAKAERGPITVTVSASGTLNAVNTVLVGSQVSGQIQRLLVDYNSVVRRGQVIARIAPEIFEAKLDRARAEVEAAQATIGIRLASLEQARADIENARAALATARAQTANARVSLLDTKRKLDRNNALFRQKLIPRSEKENSEAAYESAVALREAMRAQESAQASNIKAAQARLKVAEAQLLDARATVRQREASLRQAQAELDYTIILAPVDGVVVSRNVDVGQTVAASLQAPTLFTIAEDLRKMQVNTLVDEADISRIEVGQQATFTVDSFPGQSFQGRVMQVRKAPQVAQNVVTYDVVISAENPDLKLFPGMTANVAIVVNHKANVIKVPNAALRFQPAGAPRSVQPSPPAGAGGRGSGRGGPSLRELAPLLREKLGLEPAQRARLRTLMEDARSSFRGLRALPQEERGRQARQIQQNVLDRLKESLTPGQKETLEKLLQSLSGRGGQGFPGRVWRLGPDGRPKAVELSVGLSDGNFTEVLAGPLRAGEKIIIRAATPGDARKAAGSGRRGLRLGF